MYRKDRKIIWRKSMLLKNKGFCRKSIWSTAKSGKKNNFHRSGKVID